MKYIVFFVCIWVYMSSTVFALTTAPEFLITKAGDWPMFSFGLKAIGAGFTVLSGIICGLVAKLYANINSKIDRIQSLIEK